MTAATPTAVGITRQRLRPHHAQARAAESNSTRSSTEASPATMAAWLKPELRHTA
jgi:hypothetical protein